MRLLVTGAAGQLGHDLVAFAREEGDDVIALDRSQLDVGDATEVRDKVTTAAPDVVVNCAAWTAVDACEADPVRAERDNASAVGFLRDACEVVGAHLVQISTDYVFDGTLDRPYVETDEPNPRSVYGVSKLAGERAAGPVATIIRTSWVCGAMGGNMVKTVLRLLGERETLSFVDDQRGCPTFTADLAMMVHRLAQDRPAGIFHVTNQGAVSWYEFARDITAAAGEDPDRILPITTAELLPPRPAPRPANSVLDNAALRAAGIPLLRPYQEPLADLISLCARHKVKSDEAE